MPFVSRCSQGHQWQVMDDSQTSMSRRVVCTVCGLVQPFAEPETVASERVEEISSPEVACASTETALPSPPAVESPTLSYPHPSDTEPGHGPAVSAEAARVQVPGFQILGELGRGGMGVVYKAQQLSLKRLVALKMVLAGAQAGSEELQRFRSEAEAVAHLQHPNIVQIYEIGQFEERPFFALEFVDGGSLSTKLNGKPLPPDEAAALVEKLARAIHHAHQRQVVHRDLKPANVLLMADGTPKITDFGLAKRLEGDAGQTRSGAILGTPSYMAPEQAQGRTHDVGPLVDVYALGAILYELLTGRPPFKADSIMSTLQQVMTAEVVPPTRLQPQVHRDLETICLKALAKEPKRRYSSALALAQDLERFVAGEPILARPESVAGRLWRRCRRRRGALVTSLLLAGALGAVIYFFWSARSATRLADFTRDFEPRLQKVEWTQQYLTEMEDLAAGIAPLDPLRSAQAKSEIYGHYGQSLRRALRSESALSREEVGRIDAALALLKPRQPDLEAELRQELTTRLGNLQTIRDVRPPFEDTNALFVARAVAKKDDVLLSQAPGHDSVILMHDVCRGNVQIEAEFDPSWESVNELGLLLDASADKKQSFAFLLSAQAPGDKGAGHKTETPHTLGRARVEKRECFLKIYRNGVLLRQQSFAGGRLVSGPLRLRAGREGSLLAFEIFQDRGRLAALKFQSLFPPGGAKAGVFGLHWPAGVGLKSLQLRRQTLPPAPGPMERGDHFYAEGETAKALAVFQKQAAASLDPVLRQEARCKAALCLAALQRQDEAIRLLLPLSAEDGSRWPLLAACQLWLIYLRQGKTADAELLVESLLPRGYSADQLAAVFPEDLRQSLFSFYNADFSGFNILFHSDPKRLAGLERMTAIQDLLGVHGQRWFYQQKLIRAYRIAGESEKALQYLKRSGGEARPDLPTGRLLPLSLLEEFGWLSRELGRAADALPVFDAHLVLADNMPQYRLALVERARLLVVVERWNDAEGTLARFFQEVSLGDDNYQWYAEACLLEGFLRERRGDVKGALASWTRGLPDPKSTPRAHRLEGSGMIVLHADLLYSLTNRLGNAEAERLVDRLLASLPGEYAVAVRGLGYRPPLQVLQTMWHGRHGRDCARKIAYQSVPLRDYLQLPLLAGSAALALESFKAASAEEEDLVWKTAADTGAAIMAGKFTKGQGFQLAMTWKGTTSFFGWASVAPTLPPELRGPIAYIMGNRYLRRGQPAQAAEFFRTALRDAPPNSLLGKLAAARAKGAPAKR